MPDGSGIDLVRWLKANDVDAPMLMISGHGTIADAVEATRAGAFDFLEKPLGREKVLLSLKHALEETKLREENRRLREMVGGARMIGSSAAFERVLEQATMAARSDARVLLDGESGTGKELLAAHIHAESPFSAGPFVKVNCAAIPTELIESELFGHEKGAFTGATSARRGKFELADGGTLFLDEVGDLHASSQAKLCACCRKASFIASAASSPFKRVGARDRGDQSRSERNGPAAEIPRGPVLSLVRGAGARAALRERREDIRALAEYFLAEFCARNNFKPKTFDPMPCSRRWKIIRWPGNIRELRNTVERMAILTRGDVLEAESVPVEIRIARATGGRGNLREAKESAEREHILRALEESKWNVSSAARVLGMERTNLHKRIRALGLVRGQ